MRRTPRVAGGSRSISNGVWRLLLLVFQRVLVNKKGYAGRRDVLARSDGVYLSEKGKKVKPGLLAPRPIYEKHLVVSSLVSRD